MTKLGKGQHNKYIIPVKVERMSKSKSDANMGVTNVVLWRIQGHFAVSRGGISHFVYWPIYG